MASTQDICAALGIKDARKVKFVNLTDDEETRATFLIEKWDAAGGSDQEVIPTLDAENNVWVITINGEFIGTI